MIFKPTEDNVKLLGRTYQRGDLRWCAFSGSGVEFSMRGTKCQITIVADNKTEDVENRARIGIFVNGLRVIDDMLKEKKNTYTAYEGPERAMVISVVKLSESAMSTFAVGDIEVENGDIIPTVHSNTFIEFVGDSITCGYGVDDEDPEHHFVTSTEDCTEAFAYRTAKALGADYSLVSFSGYGVISGYTGDGVINSKELLPPHYEKLGFSYASSGEEGDEFKVSDISWEFKRQPDMVFINLGTNDASYCKEDAEKQKLYIERYVSFLKTVRKNNPGAYILCGLGIMGDVLYPSLKKAAEQYSLETGDNRISTVHFDEIKADTEGYVADYHPRRVTHRRCSDVLVAEIKRIFKKEYNRTLGERVLALTFDDGPDPEISPKVLEKLKDHGVTGTFFLVGDNIKPETEGQIRNCVAYGCDIENHSIHHTAMSDMEPADFLKEIEENSDRIQAITGRRPEFFRPPYIAVNDAMRENITLTMIAGYGAWDWEDRITAPMRSQKILAQLKNGAVILLHDREENIFTVNALDDIIEGAKSLGYEFVTVRELFKRMDEAPARGIVYSETEQARM